MYQQQQRQPLDFLLRRKVLKEVAEICVCSLRTVIIVFTYIIDQYTLRLKFFFTLMLITTGVPVHFFSPYSDMNNLC